MDNLIEKIKTFSSEKMLKYLKKQKDKEDKEDIDKLTELKEYLDDLYYNTEDCDFPDNLYDILKKFLSSDNKVEQKVGAKVKDNQITLPYWLGSADKITPEEENVLDRWLSKNKKTDSQLVMITEKLDGVSGLFESKLGMPEKLYTRGDGIKGSDISHIIPYINIPNKYGNISVRGELIIEKEIFDHKYKGTYKTARNMVTGLLGSKKPKEDELRDISFVTYEIISDDLMENQSKQLLKLEKKQFLIPLYEGYRINELTPEFLTKVHDKFKKESKYNIDGIIVHANVKYDRNTSGNPDYLFAFKVMDENNITQSTVIDIEWNISRHGQLIPVAIINPVELGGVQIQRISLSNARMMIDRKIGKGSVVDVTRSKDVIPYIVNVITPSKTLTYPEGNMDYKWDKNNVNLIVSNVSPELLEEMNIKMFASFFEKMDIKYVKEETIRKLYDNGYDTLLKIIGAKKSDLVKIEGIQDKSAERIVDNIRKGLEGVSASKILGACGIFGQGIGRKKVDSLMNDIPDLLTNPINLKERILDVEGFSDITADKIVENIDKAIHFIDEISKYVSFSVDTRVSDNLVGKIFCFSGFRSKELEQQIIDRGGKNTTSVSKKTTALIVSAKGSGSSKEANAEKFKIAILSKEELVKMYLS